MSMYDGSAKTTIFLTGATGYIGGSVLQRILQHPDVNSFEIIVLVRDAIKAQLLEADFTVKAIVGSMDDLDRLAQLAENAHIVVQCAEADRDDMMNAILAGLRKPHEQTGDVPVLIHTSGAGSLANTPGGECLSDLVVSDLDSETLGRIVPPAVHRSVDILACKADAEGYVRTYIVLPTVVFGIGEGALYDAGISKRSSTLVPLLAAIAAKRGRPGVMGAGKNAWSVVHLEDNADLTYRLFCAVLTRNFTLGHGRDGYYLTENGEVTMYELWKAIGMACVKQGLATDAEPTVFTPEERIQYFGSEAMANYCFSNVRGRGDRGRRDLGWTPEYPRDDIWKEVSEVVKTIAKKLKGDA